MNEESVFPLKTLGGVMRDFPPANVPFYTDGDMIRTAGGGVRKLGGWVKIFNGTNYIIREIFITTFENKNRTIYFTNNNILQVDSDPVTNAIINIVDRTPLDWVAPSEGAPDYMFSVTNYVSIIENPDGGSPLKTPYLFFTAMPNTKYIANATETPLYYGNLNLNTPFLKLETNVGNITTSGGVITFNGYLIVYGNDGIIRWSDLNNPFEWSAENFLQVANTKLVHAVTYLQSIYIWSLNSLEEVSFSNEENIVFTTTTRCTNISILSPKSVVNIKNSFYWMGAENFYVFNGVVAPLPNQLNKIFFYENVNPNYVGKVFGVFVENYTEIWWCWSDTTSTENNRCIIYNLQENTWVDNTLTRSASQTSSLFTNPIFASSKNSLTMTGSYPVFQHEIGWDHVEDGINFPITAFFETNRFSLMSFSGGAPNPQTNRTIRIRRVELDVLMGNTPIQLEILDYPYANSTPIVGKTYDYYNKDGKISTADLVRNGTLRVTANNLGCWFQTGIHQISFKPDTHRPAVTSSTT
jgi:hypothetical protein